MCTTLIIERPAAAGRYKVVVDMVGADDRHWGCEAAFQIDFR
jgi:hypothetical protein